jgi:Uri superfamily endonuclease
MSTVLEAGLAEMLPALPGTYALRLRVSEARVIRVAGVAYTIVAGEYLYVGSARGPGGLRARLGRHIRGDGRLRWHIDALRAVAEVTGWAYIVRDEPLECRWVQLRLQSPSVSVPIPGFGASDCRQGCPAHLLRL